MIKSKETVKRLMADGWVLSRGCSGGYLLVHLDELKHRHVLPRVAKDLEAAGEIVRCDDRTTCVGARWKLAAGTSQIGKWHDMKDVPGEGAIWVAIREPNGTTSVDYGVVFIDDDGLILQRFESVCDGEHWPPDDVTHWMECHVPDGPSRLGDSS